MAKITLMPSGINAGVGCGGNRNPGKRGGTTGWSAGSARRNMRFLMSVDDTSVPNLGFCYTLTVRDIPKDHAEWAAKIDRLRKWLYRRGVVADHWVTEWQRRGAPHLHGVCFLDPDNFDPMTPADMVTYWSDMTRHLGTLNRGQDWKPLDGLLGWKRYVAKHAGRGYAHYQRQRGHLPKGWQKTGRMWGKGGSWPVQEAAFEINQAEWFRFRRLVRSHLLAEARADLIKWKGRGDERRTREARNRISYLRRMLKRNNHAVSEVRGLNEWVDRRVSAQLLHFAAQGRHRTPEGAYDPDTGEVL